METNNNTPATTGTKLVGASGKTYKDSPKFLEWMHLVMDRSNRVTFGNFTQAAAIAYGLDLSNDTDYNSASVIGSTNYRKLKDLGSMVLQKKGVTFGMLMDVLLAKMASSQSTSWWEITMEMMGYRERKPISGGNQYNQNNYYGGSINEDQLDGRLEEIGSDQLRPEELTTVFVEGEIS